MSKHYKSVYNFAKTPLQAAHPPLAMANNSQSFSLRALIIAKIVGRKFTTRDAFDVVEVECINITRRTSL